MEKETPENDGTKPQPPSHGKHKPKPKPKSGDACPARARARPRKLPAACRACPFGGAPIFGVN
jgi:hypothetical protein